MSGKHDHQESGRRINRRAFIQSTGGAALAVASGAATPRASAAQESSRPNILLIITDQQHIDTIAAGGCPHVETPAMDRLARRGLRFEESYCANPLCSPARSALFTGRTASETGVHVNGRSIRAGIPNLGQWLREKTDYETVYAGKWHVPHSYSAVVEGFDVIHTGIGGQGNMGDTGASHACEGFLRNRSDTGPFLMVASLLQPHDICEWLRLNLETPDALRYAELADQLPPLPDDFDFDPREPAAVSAQRCNDEPGRGHWSRDHWRYYLWSYYRHVEMVDGEIGRILQALEETGRDEDTLILFTADHGEGMAHHQMVRKSNAYDAAAKVPFIVSWPGRVLEDAVDSAHLISGLDVMPTLCDFAGIEPPGHMRGRSLRPLLEGASASWRDHVVVEMPGNAGRAVRTARHKYVSYVDDPVEMLFDRQADPGETENVAGRDEHRSVLEAHRELLAQWENRLDVAPGVPNPDAWRTV